MPKSARGPRAFGESGSGWRPGDENVGWKMKSGAQVPHLLKGEISGSSHKHGNGALRAELGDEIALCEILFFD